MKYKKMKANLDIVLMIVQVLMIVFKLTDIIDCSWAVVFIPLFVWAGVSIALVIIACVFLWMHLKN